MATAEAALERPSEGTLRLGLVGSWRGVSSLPSPDAVGAALGGVERVAFDAERLTEWDTRLVSYLRCVLRECERRGIAADRSGLPKGVQQLLALAAAVPEKQTRGGVVRKSLVVRAGERALTAVDGARRFSTFLGEALIAFGRLVAGRATFRCASSWW